MIYIKRKKRNIDNRIGQSYSSFYSLFIILICQMNEHKERRSKSVERSTRRNSLSFEYISYAIQRRKKRVNTNVYHMNDSISLIYIYIRMSISLSLPYACVFVQCNWKRRGKIELYKIHLTSIDRLFILDH